MKLQWQYNAKNGAALARLVNENGVKLENLMTKFMTLLLKVLLKLWWSSTTQWFAARVHKAFVKARTEIGAWTNLSDSPYISQRNRALGL